MEKKLRLGLPKGSLNTPGRGETWRLFEEAGYDIKGYQPGKESDRSLRIANDPEIECFLARPQSAPNGPDRGKGPRPGAVQALEGRWRSPASRLEPGQTAVNH